MAKQESSPPVIGGMNVAARPSLDGATLGQNRRRICSGKVYLDTSTGLRKHPEKCHLFYCEFCFWFAESAELLGQHIDSLHGKCADRTTIFSNVGENCDDDILCMRLGLYGRGSLVDYIASNIESLTKYPVQSVDPDDVQKSPITPTDDGTTVEEQIIKLGAESIREDKASGITNKDIMLVPSIVITRIDGSTIKW
ncbi:hypothetical protein ACJ72_07823 [Emergomyces africanus]|uniref:Uncharacterized protein n=1 Tax=Emergomyces africanus TaxID=1955775 RepID=A0A1B7NM31_9EURO|nr:hypothetical protein ACJ72_07823 [Emergomyces africanus]